LAVDTNEQAARLSAALRAELVRLGRVEEHGVQLGLQGTYAGVGDLVQARRNGWDLAGVEGNRRGPLNRETYRVLATRDDGGLEVAPITGRTPDGDVLGERIVLPAEYVAEHLALGYTTTVYAAQGATVDTTHSVVTPSTGPKALYVAMSRGRDTNTAHVATVSAVEDAAQGSEHETIHRDPVAVLAGVLGQDTGTTGSRSALATATESATEAGSVRAPAELLGDRPARRHRTHRDLAGPPRRRRADLAGTAGPDRRRGRRRLPDAGAAPRRARRPRRLPSPRRRGRGPPAGRGRNTTNVIYSRITHERRFDPVGESWADWAPKVDNPEWQNYLDTLAAAAGRRAEDLGKRAAAEQPGWAVEAFGPPPDSGQERDAWEQRAGAVAAYRELCGHDDGTDALGPAPKPGQVEAYAAYRAAWRALDRPEIDREELELSDGRLRMRIRAAEREAAWAPPYVANELAGTHQAAANQRQAAALRQAEAATAANPAERVRLEQEAAQAAALADTLDASAAQLQELDDARALWLAHTAATRAAAERAKAELGARHADDAEPEQLVTAEEWLAAHREAEPIDDPYRVPAQLPRWGGRRCGCQALRWPSRDRRRRGSVAGPHSASRARARRWGRGRGVRGGAVRASGLSEKPLARVGWLVWSQPWP
jgi:hypothetical protein